LAAAKLLGVSEMRITFLSPPLNLSGGIKVILLHAGELARLGHSVTIISHGQQSRSLAERLRSIKNGRGLIFRPKIRAPSGVAHIEIEPARSITCRDVPDSDAVVATWWETADWVTALSPSKGRKFYFVQGHETYPPIPSRSRDTYKLPLKKIVVSKWLKNIMEEEYGDKDVAVVPNTVDRMTFYSDQREKQDRPTIGLLYSTAFPKGLHTSLRAIELAMQKIKNIKVISFGNERKSRRFPLPRDSAFERSPSSDQIRELYSQCDVWLTSSISDGFNLTALEAMACGTPVIATRVGWPAEGIIDNVNGILRDVDDAPGLADAVVRILTLPDKEWQVMSECAHRTTTTSSWQESTKLMEAVLAA